MPTDQPSGEVPATIDASSSQGIIVGSGVQNNYWSPRPPLTPATLAALSTSAAVARIRQLRHDDAVDLFASASPEILTTKLKALLLADEAIAVAILADLDPGKAAELISPHEDDFSWLSALPSAAEAIAAQSVALRWGHEAGTGSLERAARSPIGTEGYFRRYKQGCVYWSSHDGGRTYAVHGPIAEFHLARGGTGGTFGFPNFAEEPEESTLGTRGTWQKFDGGYIASSVHGTYRVPLAMGDLNEPSFPVAAAETRDGVESQRFEEAMIYSSEAGTFAVRSKIGEHAKRWVPISAEEEVPSYPTARVQHFRSTGRGEIVVYSSAATGVQWVSGRTLALYEKLGGPGSWLGFPAATQADTVSGRVQSFEHGSIYLGAGRGAIAIAVPAETVELAGRRLGWPVSQEKPVGGSDDETIQYFEKGVVTLRDGKREIWLRPETG